MSITISTSRVIDDLRYDTICFESWTDFCMVNYPFFRCCSDYSFDWIKSRLSSPFIFSFYFFIDSFSVNLLLFAVSPLSASLCLDLVGFSKINSFLILLKNLHLAFLYYFFLRLNFKLNTRFENIGGRLVQIPKTRLSFLILDSAPKLLKNTDRLVVLLQLLLGHHLCSGSQLTVRLRLHVTLNIILNEFPQFRPVNRALTHPKTTLYCPRKRPQCIRISFWERWCSSLILLTQSIRRQATRGSPWFWPRPPRPPKKSTPPPSV